MKQKELKENFERILKEEIKDSEDHIDLLEKDMITQRNNIKFNISTIIELDEIEEMLVEDHDRRNMLYIKIGDFSELIKTSIDRIDILKILIESKESLLTKEKYGGSNAI